MKWKYEIDYVWLTLVYVNACGRWRLYVFDITFLLMVDVFITNEYDA